MNSDTIKAQYRILGELRRVDDKALRLQTDVDRIPQDIAKLEETLATRKQALEKDKVAFDTAEKQLRQAEMTLREKEDALRKAESKMMEVKTNEEYQAALRENQTQKDAKGKLEEDTIGLLSSIDDKRRHYKELEKGFSEFQAMFQREKATLEEERQKLVVDLAKEVEKRGELRKQLDPAVATLYQRFSLRTKGALIAGTANEVCLACNVRVPPQMYNEIIGFKKLHGCPCGQRILIPVTAETELTG